MDSVNDELKDSTLAARKVEGLWTRLDGPYLWYKSDQLNERIRLRSIVKFQKGAIIIEAERFVSPRRSVVRAARDRSYDPLTMQRFVAGVEVPADPLTVDPPDLDIWPTLWRQTNKNVNESFYRHDDRQLLWYKTGDNSWSSSLFPLRECRPYLCGTDKASDGSQRGSGGSFLVVGGGAAQRCAAPERRATRQRRNCGGSDEPVPDERRRRGS